jgi:RNA polymerase sigma factor (sigma-70 family)
VALPPFQSFLDEHRDVVRRVLVASLGSEEADDAFQETFISALRAFDRLRPDSDLRAWVLTIAHRKALDAHRARSRRAVPVERAGEDVPAAPATPVAAERDGALWARVRALPPKQRGAVVHRVLLDLPYAEVARIIGGSEEAARRSAHDGLNRLRREMTR